MAFSLFSCSSVLDSMLFKATAPQDAPVQRILLHDIVNPLRRCYWFCTFSLCCCRNKLFSDECAVCSKGFVHGRHIMRFREQLQGHGYSHSFTTDEKGQSDPKSLLKTILLLETKLEVVISLVCFRSRGVPHHCDAPHTCSGTSAKAVLFLIFHSVIYCAKLWIGQLFFFFSF